MTAATTPAAAVAAIARAAAATPPGLIQFCGLQTTGKTIRWHNYLTGESTRIAKANSPGQITEISAAALAAIKHERTKANATPDKRSPGLAPTSTRSQTTAA